MRSSSAALRALSTVYGALAAARNRLYDTGVLRPTRVPGVVVSVGNIEAGGTGKTPFVMALAGGLAARGVNVAVVTRGYKGRIRGPVHVRPGHTSLEVGDEALLMALSLARVPVVKSPDRVRGALFARARFGAEAILLDDAFQHRRIHRDLDIVLVARDLPKERLLPAGMLREPAGSLARAHHVIAMKGCPLPYPKADLAPVCLVDTRWRTAPLELVRDEDVLAFCAVGSPGHFFETAGTLCRVVDTIAFADHHRYTAADARAIAERAARAGYVLTTEKDLVRMEPGMFGELEGRLFALRVALSMEGLEEIEDEIQRMVETRRVHGQG
ncbi:MAG TPA: tetraacyldisaccharide 4'-kinase [Deltaproteobacteria bacterium]|nr:tetraacyldisaccharide 4'-kinase [Deltaproteobacteria bacterium]HOM29824.1 tetraacyldisaccharide 4'-kinase [Deltaproteobacteria bacterium]